MTSMGRCPYGVIAEGSTADLRLNALKTGVMHIDDKNNP